MSLINVGDSQTFSYTGSVETFTADVDGLYELEVYGASGGNNIALGGYSVGYVELKAGDTLYVCVGGKGADGNTTSTSGTSGGYNGGGAGGGAYGTDYNGGGGGGATHIATMTGTLASIGSANLDKILIVAGGGGGYGRQSVTHSGGGGLTTEDVVGTRSVYTIYGSTQSASGTGTTTVNSGTFGQGGNGRKGSNNSYGTCGCGGGGGGLYGGSAMGKSGSNTNASGAGGSGYIGGVPEITFMGTTYTPSTTSGQRTGNGEAIISLIAQYVCMFKVNGTWRNAIPYVKVNGSWEEGSPRIKINGSWASSPNSPNVQLNMALSTLMGTSLTVDNPQEALDIITKGE